MRSPARKILVRLLRGFVVGLLLYPQLVSAGLQSYAIIGDAGVWNESTRIIRDSVVGSRIRHLILPGDNLYDPNGSYDQVWNPWWSAGLTAPFVAIGNHFKSYEEEIRYFRMPAEAYTRVIDSTRWIVLNSDNEATPDVQARWLQSLLEASREEFLFIVLHHPPYTVTKFHPWTEKRRFQENFRRLLWAYRHKITALIVGHDHVASLMSLNEIPMIVSGATQDQRPEPPMNYDEGTTKVRTVWTFQGRPHWTRLDIDSDTKEVWVNYVDTPRNWVACSVRVWPRPYLLRPNCNSR